MTRKKVIVCCSVVVILFIFCFFWHSISKCYVDFIVAREVPLRITLPLVSSIVTLFAMFVALFKEDIRGWVVKPKLAVSLDTKLAETTKVASGGTRSAVEYYYKKFVTNTGNVPATLVEVYLDKLTAMKDGQTEKEIEVDGIPLRWQCSANNQIMIPPKSRKSLVLFKIIPKEDVSTPDQTTRRATAAAIIKIGENEYPAENHGTVWKLFYSVYADNASTISIALSITWNGSWQARLTEMSDVCVISEA